MSLLWKFLQNSVYQEILELVDFEWVTQKLKKGLLFETQHMLHCLWFIFAAVLNILDGVIECSVYLRMLRL